MIELHTPKVEDLWFRAECLADSETMAYNAGYDVEIEGYHFDTGCIDFSKDKWQGWAERKLQNPNFFYGYILDKSDNKFVGEVNFSVIPESKKACMGIVIKSEYRRKGYMRSSLKLLCEEAKKRGVEYLTDDVPASSESALAGFFDLGFKKVREKTIKKFGKDELVFELEKKL